MTTFENLAQRGIHSFIATMPSFNAVKSQSASEKEQENAYNFIKGIYTKLYSHPELLGLKIHPDDCYEFWWTKRAEKPGLTDKIRSYIKNTNLIVETIYTIISSGVSNGVQITLAKDKFEVKPAMLKKLANLEITTKKYDANYYFTFPKDTVNGLKQLAKISAEHSQKSATVIHNKTTSPFLLFSRGVFNPEAPYLTEIFRGLYENKESYDKLLDYLSNNNFIRVDNKEYKTGHHCETISFDYVKFYGKPEGSIGDSWKTKNFSGVTFSYDENNEDCTRIGVHIPYFREILENTEKMSPTLRVFITKWNKCTGCRYCVQMDKSKTKPLRFVKVDDSNVCSVFAGGCTFNQFYDGTWMADSIIELLNLVDELFSDKNVGARIARPHNIKGDHL